MNKNIFTIILLAAATCCLTAQTGTPAEADEPQAPDSAERIKDIYPRWSVTGEWRVTHPAWTDVVTLGADGSLVTSRQGTTGRWILTAEGGTPLLVFRWDLFGTESLAMVSPNHFRGQTRNGRFIDMRRGDERDDERHPSAQH
jgi:hypothetical protein